MNKGKIEQALLLMKKGHDILKKADQENLKKSAYFLRSSIERIKLLLHNHCR